MSQLDNIANAPDIFFHENGKYFFLDADDKWIAATKDVLNNHLKVYHGLVGLDADRVAAESVYKRNVTWYGQLAGKQPGIHYYRQDRVLITRGFQTPEPKRGSWPIIQRLIAELLGGQADHFTSWLKVGLEALRAQRSEPGQVMALAGPKNCGKSFLREYVITPILGNRSASPYAYLTNQTDKNAELFAAEVLSVDDQFTSTDSRARKAFGQGLKNFVATPDHRCRGMYRDGIDLKPFWRVVICVNDDPISLSVLPPHDSSVYDKIFVLRCEPATFPDYSGPDWLAKRDAHVAAVTAELPAFAHWLIHEYEIPEGIRDNRFGVVAYQDPAMQSSIDELSPEAKLDELIDTYILGDRDGAPWEGTPQELERELREHCEYEVRQLCSYASAMGHYLNKLEKRFEDSGRYTWAKIGKNRKSWTITR